jgi:ABC-type Na+ efflux pump permease subunit
LHGVTLTRSAYGLYKNSKMSDRMMMLIMMMMMIMIIIIIIIIIIIYDKENNCTFLD